MRCSWLILLIGLVSGCTHSSKTIDEGRLSGAAITYYLPEATASVSVNLSVTDCTPDAQVKPEITVAIVASQGSLNYRLEGGELASWNKTRDIYIALNENRSIKTVNAMSADKTGAIVTNVIKGVASIVAIAGAKTPTNLMCSKETIAALEMTKVIQLRLKALRASLLGKDQRHVEEVRQSIDSLANEFARLKNSKELMIPLPVKTIDMTRAAGTIDWASTEIPMALISSAAAGNSSGPFKLAYCLEKAGSSPDATKCTLQHVTTLSANPVKQKAPSCPGDENCKRTLVLREPETVLLTLVAAGSGFGNQQTKRLKAVTLPVPQWGEFSYLALDVGIAESRTVGVTLDEYGRRTAMSWKSDARAETLTGAVTSELDAGSNLKKSIDGRELSKQKSEIETLQTQQTLNKLKFCEDVIQAGGYTCPAN
jgi:hypothetical protein